MWSAALRDHSWRIASIGPNYLIQYCSTSAVQWIWKLITEENLCRFLKRFSNKSWVYSSLPSDVNTILRWHRQNPDSKFRTYPNVSIYPSCLVFNDLFNVYGDTALGRINLPFFVVKHMTHELYILIELRIILQPDRSVAWCTVHGRENRRFSVKRIQV